MDFDCNANAVDCNASSAAAPDATVVAAAAGGGDVVKMVVMRTMCKTDQETNFLQSGAAVGTSDGPVVHNYA